MFLTDSRFGVLSGCPPGRGMPAVPELGALGCILASLSGCLLAAFCFQGTSRSQRAAAGKGVPHGRLGKAACRKSLKEPRQRGHPLEGTRDALLGT